MTVVTLSIIALPVLALIVLPFFGGSEQRLVACAALNSQAKLLALKKEILHRYLTAEMAWKRKLLTDRAWHNRRLFLLNRYVDVCRRLDFLAMSAHENKEAS